MSEPRLCYVSGAWAFFTTREPFTEQWGDDWNDAPYEHNAGRPSRWADYMDCDPYEIVRVAFDAALESPADMGGANSRWSVEQINAGGIAWLQDRWGMSNVIIPAGVTLAEFKGLIAEAGGQVYELAGAPPESEEGTE